MSKLSGRGVAVSVLRKFDSGRGDVSDLLKEALIHTGERGKATDLVYGVVRNRNLIDHLLDKFGNINKGRVKGELLNILRIGVYEIVFCPGIEIYAAVNEAVSLGRSGKQRGFLNAVLRNICRAIDNRRLKITEMSDKIIPQNAKTGCMFKEPVLPDPQSHPNKYLSTAFSLPEWLTAEWIDEFGFETAYDVCMASNRKSGVYIQPNTLKITADELIRKFESSMDSKDFLAVCDGRMIKVTGKDISSLPGFDEGLFTIQDPTAAAAMEMLDPKEGQTIVDLCAAPGGKTVRLAQLTAGNARIIAADIDAKRLEKVKENCQRLNIKSVETVSLESLDARIQNLKVDAVVADVPCSNTGVMARRCEVRHRITKDKRNQLCKLQTTILEKAAVIIGNEGKICYSTCSILHRENRNIVNSFLKTHLDFKLVEDRLTLAQTASNGRIDCDGGYVAVLERSSINKC